MKITIAKAIPDYKIEVTFDDGVSGIIDLKEFIANGIFSELKDEHFFKRVYTNGYSIAWSEELEIDMLTVYAELSGKKPEDIQCHNFSHALN